MTPQRFQSQSFNWLNRQRLRWNDRLHQGWRSVQMAVTWGMQLLLYPVYVAVQSSRLLLHQWQHPAPSRGLAGEAAEPSSALTVRNREAPSDAMPDFVALFFKALAGQFTFRPRPPVTGEGLVSLATEPKLQGIASLRRGSTRYPEGSLVWVDDRNQIWSIPLAHQQALQYQMLTIVTNHTPVASAAPLKLLPERAQQLPPVRWARRLMNWMQTSPLARSTNLFQESHIQPLLPAPFPNPLPPQFQMRVQEFSVKQSDAMVRFLDYHLALLEPQIEPQIEPQRPIVSPPSPQVQAPVPSLSAKPVSPPVEAVPVPALAGVRSQEPGITGMTLRQHLLGAEGIGAEAREISKTQEVGKTQKVYERMPQPLGSQVNLQFSPEFNSEVKSAPKTIGTLASVLPLGDPSTPLPPVLPPETFPPQISPESPPELPLELPPQSLLEPLSEFISEPLLKPLPELLPERSLRITSQIGTVQMETSDPAQELIQPLAQASGQPPRQKPPVLPPAEQVEDIEVKSEAIGYEKHPLEQLLHWIDRVVTWIEQQLTKLFP